MARDKSKFNRRQFIARATAAGAGLSAIGFSACGVRTAESQGQLAGPPPTPAGKSKLVLAKDEQSVGDDGMVNADVVAEMLGRSMMEFTGAGSSKDAWGGLFSSDDIVGVKINCLFGFGASTHPEVTTAVVAGLISGGVKAENIIVWDREDKHLLSVGYEINRDGPGPRYYGVNGDWEDEATKHRSINGRIAKVLSQGITALVNVPILKDHGISGITAAMKNHYGSFDNPNKHHGNHCDPYVADFNSLDVVKEKTRLLVCDALLPVANGGPKARPEHTWAYKGLMVGQDPVAFDYEGSRIIEARRAEIGLPSLVEADKPPLQLASAAALGLGTKDPEYIDLVEV